MVAGPCLLYVGSITGMILVQQKHKQYTKNKESKKGWRHGSNDRA
jgi:hypothetical protein